MPLQLPPEDAAAPLAGITPADATVAAFDALGAEYEHAFADLPALDATVDRMLAALGPGSRVLDVGAGTGHPVCRRSANSRDRETPTCGEFLDRRHPVAARLAAAGHRVTGLDVSPRMVELARAQVPGASFVCADVRTWPCLARSFDAICVFFSLLTMPRPELEATLARLPGGRLALATVPADVDGVPITFLDQPITAYSYPTETLVDRLRALGLVIDRHHLDTFRPDHPAGVEEQHLFLECHAPRSRPEQPTGRGIR